VACSNSKNEQVEVSAPTDSLVITNTVLLPPDTAWLSDFNPPLVVTIPEPTAVPLQYPYGLGKPLTAVVDVASGLPANITTDVAVDRDGNLWVSSLGHLSKYDGTKFTNYFSRNGLGSGFISQILLSRTGDLWIGNYDGVFRFDGKAFHKTALSNFDLDFNLRAMVEDSAGVLWVASSNGLYRMEGDSVFKYASEHGVPDNTVWSVHITVDGRILIDGKDGIMQVQDTAVVPMKEIFARDGKSPRIKYCDSSNNIWFTQSIDGKLHLGKNDGIATTFFSEADGFPNIDYVSDMLEDDNGNLWILASQDMIHFNGKTFTSTSFNESHSSKFATSFANDDVGNFWVGSDIGLIRLSYDYLNKLEIPKLENIKGLGDKMYADAQGRKWTTNDEGDKVIGYHQKEAYIYDFSKVSQNIYISQFFIDSTGEHWFTSSRAGSAKLNHLVGNTCYEYGPEQGFNMRYVVSITQKEDGSIELLGEGGKVIFNGEAFIQTGKKQGIHQTVVSSFMDSKGNEWMGSEREGIIRINHDSIDHFQGEAVPKTWINFINEDPFGNIWFGSDEGLVKFNGQEFENYGEDAGIGKLVSGITVDTTRRLMWFSLINGLATLSFDEIDSPDPKFNVYSQRNGFDAISSHFQRSLVYFDSAGVWCSAFSGIYRFDYDKVTHFDAPKLEIQNIRVNNQPVVWSLLKNNEPYTDSIKVLNESVLKFGKKLDNQKRNELAKSYGRISYDSLQRSAFVPLNLSLPYNNNSITFEFSSISPSFGKHTQYRYKLEGYEENWSPLSTKNEAYFGNMSEGEYVFRLEATSAYGTHSELSYTFRVLPPWWRTWWAYVLYGLLFAIVLKRVHMFQKARSIKQERERAQQVELKQAKEIEKAYHELKATQQQLIQSEKMASLGELTAGIAHEIQNPLNFVNNFSEISAELIDELKTELDKGDVEEAKSISSDIKQNLEKIAHHGKRADAIVKGMLAHSRSGKGEKEPTDLNALAEEYLKLSYHGLRAKDKSFNVDFKTDFDPDLPKVNVVPQDIGRVLLNLINNAFQAVNEKSRKGEPGYKSEVSVKTQLKTNKQILITIHDNGPGIPDSIKDKIFQPFFTTKPAGQGTGLGLSLSYDIVKAHGGELKIESTTTEGAVFTIVLPTKAK
jgi:signal transduction histidine kinase/ligand-binding sensor domain-containing protein